MVNKIMKQLESQTSKIHKFLFKKKHNNNNAQVVLSRRRGTEGSSSTYSLLLVYYSGAAITSSMRAPWSNAEDLGKRATRSGVEQTRQKKIKTNKNN